MPVRAALPWPRSVSVATPAWLKPPLTRTPLQARLRHWPLPCIQAGVLDNFALRCEALRLLSNRLDIVAREQWRGAKGGCAALLYDSA